MGEHVTVRIPELPSMELAEIPLGPDDRLPIWNSADDKTRHTKLSTLRSYLDYGSPSGLEPVINGAKILYITTASDAGQTTVNIPEVAGESFNLIRSGQPLKVEKAGVVDPEYRILSGGGFELIGNSPAMEEEERFELEVYTKVGGSTTVSASGGGSALVTGKVVVSTNTTMTTSNHLRKLIQLRAGATQISLTLPSIVDIPNGTIIPIEASVSNDFQNAIQTQGGQYIYMNGGNYQKVYIANGEALWLYRDDDGFYVINDFGRNYMEVGRIESSYRVNPGELLANGAVYSRAAYPRLWEFVQSLGGSLISDSLWNTASAIVDGQQVSKPYRGCFSTGDGSTTFRVPDLMDVSLRGVKSTTGTDATRLLNKPGGFQAGQVGEFDLKITGYLERKSGTSDNIYVLNQRTAGSTPGDFTQTINAGKTNAVPNVGVLWTIKC